LRKGLRRSFAVTGLVPGRFYWGFPFFLPLGSDSIWVFRSGSHQTPPLWVENAQRPSSSTLYDIGYDTTV
jgi:hypothetical protein